ncbi:LacI family transcriptional regulator [Acidiferrimicrobium sp. IK]|uniref:LacI family DNA-binding transcriptional regulator n=1 Tax=Acidiferrimicrobium sp. IK TaxID=2871700 RepID=UPI0021CB5DD4|nr:LacI family DNA-binding transcriptional regulator [Acidiferrimicrobium sp. IK]MCU4186726.1 LacI family transcriptional regulator [Acidiferrimicrobium sp. IK]
MEPSGAGAPTIYDVADRAGVSIATVSRVLNGHTNLRAATRQRVMDAVGELKFVPNGAARGLSQGLKKVVGIVFDGVPATDDLLSVEEETLLFSDSIVRGAEAGASQLGYSLLLNSAGGSSGDPERTINGLTGKVDGLILLDRVLPERRVAPLAKRIPMVLLAGSGRTRSAVTVRVDNAAAMADVAAHLVSGHGFRRLAFVSGLAASPDSTTRAQSFVASVTELGGTVQPLEAWAADWTSGGAARATRQWLESGGELPEGIACANDQMAIGVMHVLAGAGVKVPEEVAVVGFDDIPVVRHLSPALTSVRQPSRQLGATAVEVLVGLVEGRPPASRDIVLPTQLQIRGSCGCRAEHHGLLSETWDLGV